MCFRNYQKTKPLDEEALAKKLIAIGKKEQQELYEKRSAVLLSIARWKYNRRMFASDPMSLRCRLTERVKY